MKKLKLTVTTSEAGLRLDKFLAGQLLTQNRTQLAALIKLGHVKVEQVVVTKPSSKVSSQQLVSLVIPEPAPTQLREENLPLLKVFEDEHLLVINKPSKLAVHPPPGKWQGSLVNALLFHYGEQIATVGEPERPGIVHRLDKDTTGLLLVAKTAASYRELVHQFKLRQVSRTYLALVWGEAPLVGHWEERLARSKYDRLKMTVSKDQGKLAVTNFVRMNCWRKSISLLQLSPVTGRTHQLRVQACHHGLPIVADPSYGKPRLSLVRHLSAAVQSYLKLLSRQQLHATAIDFRHPLTGQLHHHSCPLPGDMQQLVDLLNQAANDKHRL